jgi:hypothetical protein
VTTDILKADHRVRSVPLFLSFILSSACQKKSDIKYVGTTNVVSVYPRSDKRIGTPIYIGMGEFFTRLFEPNSFLLFGILKVKLGREKGGQPAHFSHLWSHISR